MLTKVLLADEQHIAQAARLLLAGEVVAFPTETVYGLGALADDPEAVAKVYEAKGRPSDNPLIWHVASADGVLPYVRVISPLAADLMRLFWPGPLTLVLAAKDPYPDTIAFRCPSHQVAHRLLELVGRPIAAPSANLSGRPSPTQAKDVFEDLIGRIPLILDGGPTHLGLESTVIDASGPKLYLLRPGSLPIEQIEEKLGVAIELEGGLLHRSPGTRYRHYAPLAKVVTTEELPSPRMLSGASKAGLLTPYEMPIPGVWSKSYGQKGEHLFTMLREADREGIELLYVVLPIDQGLGRAIRDRLVRAANS